MTFCTHRASLFSLFFPCLLFFINLVFFQPLKSENLTWKILFWTPVSPGMYLVSTFLCVHTNLLLCFFHYIIYSFVDLYWFHLYAYGLCVPVLIRISISMSVFVIFRFLTFWKGEHELKNDGVRGGRREIKRVKIVTILYSSGSPFPACEEEEAHTAHLISSNCGRSVQVAYLSA